MQIAQEYALAQQERAKRPRTLPSQSVTPSGSGAAAYYVHFANIRQHLSIEDFSRVDAMIALRMRTTGHSREAVVEVIRQCAPDIREKFLYQGAVAIRQHPRAALFFIFLGKIRMSVGERKLFQNVSAPLHKANIRITWSPNTTLDFYGSLGNE